MALILLLSVCLFVCVEVCLFVCLCGSVPHRPVYSCDFGVFVVYSPVKCFSSQCYHLHTVFFMQTKPSYLFFFLVICVYVCMRVLIIVLFYTMCRQDRFPWMIIAWTLNNHILFCRTSRKPGGYTWPTRNVIYSSQLPSMFAVSKRRKR